MDTQAASAARDEDAQLIEIYADGACKGNPGAGGWGVLLRGAGSEKELLGAEAQTTNNRMELTAVIRGLEALKRPCSVVVYTDSQYVQKGISEWIRGWKRNGWRTADKKPVKNADLWRQLDELAAGHTISWRWVRGHSGNPGNERVDALANKAIEELRKGAGA
jgi:ribonuclease HI